MQSDAKNAGGPGTPNRYQEHLGLEVLEARDGHCLARLHARDELGNRRGDIHGGALASLADVALSRAIRSLLSDDSSLATIHLEITYLEVARGPVDCRAEALKVGGSVAMAQATLQDAQGRVLAKASGTFRILRRRHA